MIPVLLFAYFATVLIASALIGITRRNLVHSLLWILLMFIHIGGIYLLLNAEFLAMVQIIVYAGAILVMFLFVIFLLNIKEEVKESIFIRSWQGRLYAVLILLFFFLTGSLTYRNNFSGDFTIELIEKQGHTKIIGLTLFNEYLYPFLILGFILLIPLIGIVIVAERRKKDGTS